jgi:hypothetical protein
MIRDTFFFFYPAGKMKINSENGEHWKAWK